MSEINAHQLLEAYRHGYFPMAEHRHAETFSWFKPEIRGIIPLDDFHLPRSLRKVLKKAPFEIRFDSAFRESISACAEVNESRTETWINERIINLYTELHQMGHAHSAEAWLDGKLVGGVYGVQINGAFFGESMFSRKSNASRVALVHLVHHLQERGFLLFDTQYWNPHLEQFGCIEMDDASYMKLLQGSLVTPCTF